VRHDRPLAPREGERRQRLRLGHEHLLARVGGHGKRPGHRGVEVERALGGPAVLHDGLLRERQLGRRRPDVVHGLQLVLHVEHRRGRLLGVGVRAGAQRRHRDQLALQRPQLADRDAARYDRHDLPGTLLGRRLVGAERLLEPLERRAQLELPEHLPQARAVGPARDALVEVHADLDLALGCSELLRDPRVLGVLAQVLLALRARDRVDVRQHPFEVAVLLEQLGGGLLADAGDARDVVGGVALEADEVGDERRRDAVAVEHRLGVVDRRVGDPAAGRHHAHAVLHELEEVAVAGHDHHVDPLLVRLARERGDHVVRLVALDAHVRVAESVHERVEVRPLLLEQVGPLAPPGLVLLVGLEPSGHARVPGHQRRLRPVLGEQLHEHRREAEDRVGGESPGRRDRLREREEGAVHEAVPVDQEQLAGLLVGHGSTLAIGNGGAQPAEPAASATAPRLSSVPCPLRAHSSRSRSASSSLRVRAACSGRSRRRSGGPAGRSWRWTPWRRRATAPCARSPSSAGASSTAAR
jgi:hypothetical protein